MGTIFVLFFIILTYSIPSSSCWSTKIHQAIGMVTMSSLNSKVSRFIKYNFSGKDLVDTASWGSSLAEHYPSLKVYQTMYQRDIHGECQDFHDDEVTCPGGNCLLRMLKSVYDELSNGGENATMSLLTFKLNESDLLKLLTSYIAELHNPLNFGKLSDLGGHDLRINIQFQNLQLNSNLYDLYSKNLIDSTDIMPDVLWNGGWTHAKTLGIRANIISEEWASTTDKKSLFERWAKESHKTACQHTYVYGGSLVDDEMVAITGINSLIREIQTQILLAGVRTSFVLEHLLENRTTQHLRQKSSLDLQLEEDELKAAALNKSMMSSSHMKNFLINFGIFATLLGIFLFYLRVSSSKHDSYTKYPMPPQRTLPVVDKRCD